MLLAMIQESHGMSFRVLMKALFMMKAEGENRLRPAAIAIDNFIVLSDIHYVVFITMHSL